MLRILKGRAGQGKTAQALRRMKAEGKSRPQLLLVPEQASFEAEQRLCRENGNQAGQYGEVLSFTRLENRVLSLAGGGAQPVLDEGGRLLTMYAALRSLSGKLTVYAMPSQRPEFLSSLIATMDELKSCCVTGAQLAQVGEDTEGIDGDKLRDLGLIFAAYEALIARGSLDPRDRLTRLAEKLRRYPFFQNKDVCLDGFTDFTPQQGLVLEQVLRQAHTVTVCLTCGDQEGEEAVFAPAQRTIAWLKRLAEKANCPVTEEWLPPQDGPRTLPLNYLEETLFTHTAAPYPGPWDGSVRLGTLPTPREEVRFAAGEIRRLVEQEGFRYRDIALSARTMDRYWEQIEGIFAQYELPVFQAEKTDILQKPIFTLITAALDTVTGGYLYEDIFRYLKTGLAGVTLEECDRLENYVLTWDLRGSRWTSSKGWKQHPGGYHQTFTEEDTAALEELNALRLRVVEPLERLRKGAGDTIASQVLALYRFLEDIQAPEALEARAAALLERGEPELAREYSQLWQIFCQGLEQCIAILGETEASLSEFARLLRLLLSRYSVGTIPASLDRITAGDAQRLGGRKSKVLFLLGADEGSIPLIAPGQGLLTDRDRALLEDYGLDLGPGAEEKLNRESTIVYTICAQPTQRLYITWPAGGEGGGELRPSFLVERLRVLFPQAEQPFVPAMAPDQLRALAAHTPELRDALGSDPACAALFAQLDRAAAWERGKLSPQAVRRLYGERVAMSASRMDQYSSCHFGYFLRYGLGAQERRKAGFDAPEYGTFVHFVLEQVLKGVGRQGGAEACGEEELKSLTRQAIQDYVQTRLGGLEHQTPRFRYLFRRLERSVLLIVENVVDELRHSDFEPIFFELGFGTGDGLPPVELKEGGITLRISGLVDRVDGWEKDGRLYLRVVDYKTGRKSFDLTEVWNGMGLQMLLYLFALEEHGKRLFHKDPIPAGLLYLPAREVAVAGKRDMDEDQRRKEVDKELVRRGLILEEPEVVEAMEHLEGKEPRFLPLRLVAKTGQLTGETLVSAERLGRLKRHTQAILGQICQEIAAGNIDADPYWRSPEKTACRYCPYHPACHFEEGRDRRRIQPTVPSSEFWAMLAQGEGEESHGCETDT